MNHQPAIFKLQLRQNAPGGVKPSGIFSSWGTCSWRPPGWRTIRCRVFCGAVFFWSPSMGLPQNTRPGKLTVCELENGYLYLFIVDLPFFEMVIVHSYVNVYQRVSILSVDWSKVKLEPESPMILMGKSRWVSGSDFPVKTNPPPLLGWELGVESPPVKG